MAPVARALEAGDGGLATTTLVAEVEVPELPQLLREREVGGADRAERVEHDPTLALSRVEHLLRDLGDLVGWYHCRLGSLATAAWYCSRLAIPSSK